MADCHRRANTDVYPPELGGKSLGQYTVCSDREQEEQEWMSHHAQVTDIILGASYVLLGVLG